MFGCLGASLLKSWSAVRIFVAILASTLLVVGAASATAIAAPADLDPTFGAGGALTFPIVSGEDRVESVAVQPDGKIVAAGRSFNGSNWDFAVARFNADGTADTSFSGDGRLTLDVTGGARHDEAYAVAVQPDGKIVVAGYSFAGLNEVFAIARFMPDGTLDGGFGGSAPGVALRWFPPGPSSNERAEAVALQPDGKIVVAGHTNVGGTTDFGVIRLTSSGAYDSTFGSGGTVRHAIGTGSDEINDIALQPDGKIVAVGESEGATTDFDIAVARYNADGSFDTSFNAVGVQTTAVTAASDYGRGAVVQPDGKIVVAGYARAGASRDDIVLARFGPGGGLDPSFGTGGIAATSLVPYTTQALDIALQNNGKLVVAGEYYLDSPPVQDFLVAQYNSAGALDTSFDGDGVFTRAFASPGGDAANAVAVQSDGKIVAGGFAYVGSNYDFALMRLAGELPIVNPIAPRPPTVTIQSPGSKRVRAKKLRSFKGTAGPPGDVAMVEIALRRVDKKQLKRRRCLWMKNAQAKFAKSKAVENRCGVPRFLKASGMEEWSFRLKRRLKPGVYELYVRVTLRSGGRHAEFSKAAGNFQRFAVK